MVQHFCWEAGIRHDRGFRSPGAVVITASASDQWKKRELPSGRRGVQVTTRTTMSNPCLPAEVLDHVVDLLQNTEHALRNCSLVSKSWIPRARKHIFADIRLDAKGLRSWRETFPDPSASPASYAKILFVNYLEVFAAADIEAGGWIRAFSHVVDLKLSGTRLTFADEPPEPLVPFHGTPPSTESLGEKAPILSSSQIFDFILSFPLLEDLTVSVHGVPTDGGPDASPTTDHPSIPPMTGSLRFLQPGIHQREVMPFARRLLSLPGGIHFQKLSLTLFCEEDVLLIRALVAQCSQTLESLDINCELSGTSVQYWIYTDLLRFLAERISTPADLSKAAGLKSVAFQIRSESVNWITMTLQTITPERRDPLQVTIDIPCYTVLTATGIHDDGPPGEAIRQQWLNLDHHLVQLWESRLIYLRVGCSRFGEEQHTESFIGCLLPEVMKRGAADPLYLVRVWNHPSQWRAGR